MLGFRLLARTVGQEKIPGHSQQPGPVLIAGRFWTVPIAGLPTVRTRLNTFIVKDGPITFAVLLRNSVELGCELRFL